MTKYLTIIEGNPSDGYSAHVPELNVIASADTLEEIRDLISEGIALYLDAAPDAPKPRARTLDDLKIDLTEFENPTGELIAPAIMNPVSLEIDRAIQTRNISRRELARRLEVGNAAVQRMIDPFYWGHSMAVLRRVAAALEMHLEPPKFI